MKTCDEVIKGVIKIYIKHIHYIGTASSLDRSFQRRGHMYLEEYIAADIDAGMAGRGCRPELITVNHGRIP